MEATTEIVRRRRYDLWLATAAFIVVCAVNLWWVHEERSDRIAEARTHGLSVVRLLARVPLDELRDSARTSHGPLQFVSESRAHPDFGYAAVVDTDERTIAEVTAPGVLPPPPEVPQAPVAWSGERRVDPAEGGQVWREIWAPVVEDGERVAQVRVGLAEPSWSASFAKARLRAALSMLVLPLVLVALVMVGRERRPLLEATELLRSPGTSLTPLPLDRAGEGSDFKEAFNQFIVATGEQAREAQRGLDALTREAHVAEFRRDRLAGLLDTLPLAVVKLDEARVATFATSRLKAVLGVSPEDVLDRRPAEWPMDASAVDEIARLIGRGKTTPVTEHIELATEHHPARTIAVTTCPMTDGTLLVARDATRETMAEQVQAEFVLNVAHELKNPMQVLASYAEALLEESGEDPDFRREACNAIQDESHRLADLVNTLLGIARIEMGAVSVRRERLQLSSWIDEVVEANRLAARDREIQVDLPSRITPIHVDKELFRVAVNNLLTNAVKYSDPGSEILVRIEEDDREVRLSVADHGIGIPETELGKLFTKFYRVDSPEKKDQAGHGLGLALTKEIVDLHAGRLGVESAVGSGSTFTIAFEKTPILLGGTT